MSDLLLTKETPKYSGWKVTREEYLSLPDDGFKYDMVDGVLVVSPSGNFDHGLCQSKLIRILGNYLSNHKIGKVVTKVDVFLPDAGDVIRPDITLILNQNLSIVKGHIHGVPDLVCEVLSEFTRKRDLGTKADRYLMNGVKEYWILEPKISQMSVWFNSNHTEWKKRDGEILESFILKELSIKSEWVF
ncbi:MAG: Uma2 family endonuclease [Leptospira sp.]|nr:Uma2 family endonuclease [Leptospira sp.]